MQAGFLLSGIPAKVWKDPYVTDRDRKETDRNSSGLRLTWDRIFSSHLQLQYSYRKIDIDKEKSGEVMLGLPANERDLLKRDGDSHSGEVLYRFNLGNGHFLAPAFGYTKDNRDGDAMTSDAYNFQLTYAYFEDPISFSANALIGQSETMRLGKIGPQKWSPLGGNGDSRPPAGAGIVCRGQRLSSATTAWPIFSMV